jgi:hypothetical protein
MVSIVEREKRKDGRKGGEEWRKGWWVEAKGELGLTENQNPIDGRDFPAVNFSYKRKRNSGRRCCSRLRFWPPTRRTGSRFTVLRDGLPRRENTLA